MVLSEFKICIKGNPRLWRDVDFAATRATHISSRGQNLTWRNPNFPKNSLSFVALLVSGLITIHGKILRRIRAS
jgi:hypothetical protein